MIGWTRCHYDCGCIDEDACVKAPKNIPKRCSLGHAICSSEWWGRCNKCVPIEEPEAKARPKPRFNSAGYGRIR